MSKSGPLKTAKSIEHIKPGATRQERPAGPPGGLFLVVHAAPSDRKTWALRYRFGKKTRNLKIGTYPIVGLAAAREKAVLALRALDKGIDPATKPAEGADAVLAVAEHWLKREVATQRTSTETERVIRKEIIAAWKDRRVSEINKADVNKLLEAIVDRGAPVMANRVFEILRRWFRWQVAKGYVELSPMYGMSKPTQETPRDRVLSEPELRAVWNAAKTLPYPFGEYVQMYFLLGHREEQTASMSWSELDLARAVWSVPRESAKMNRPLEVPLCKTALEILSRVPRFVKGDFVFSHNGGQSPTTGFSAAKAALDAAVEAAGHEVEHWTLHDSRRCISTFLSKSGTPPHVTKLVLAHSRRTALGSVDAVYDQHSYLEEKRAALSAWADYLTSLEAKTEAAAAS